jgi:hypothetical protein
MRIQQFTPYPIHHHRQHLWINGKLTINQYLSNRFNVKNRKLYSLPDSSLPISLLSFFNASANVFAKLASFPPGLEGSSVNVD